MSTLLLIRHGQASFGAADYDVLSPLGIEQVEHLGAHLAARGTPIDAIYSGPARRQQDSALHLRRAAAEVDRLLPEVEVLDELDEYPAFELFRAALPQLRERMPDIDQFLAPTTAPMTAGRAFRAFSEMWGRGEIDTGELETFSEFETRVNVALDRIMVEQGRGKSIAVLTSGGPISLAMRRALQLNETHALRCAWVLANASLSEFRYRDDEFSLVAFNRVPHLAHSRLVTYR